MSKHNQKPLPMHEDAEIKHLIGDMTPGSLWIRWAMSDEDVSFGGYVRLHSPESLKEPASLVANKAGLYDYLIALTGHIQDGSNTTVTLSQDDATHTKHITVGKQRFWGHTWDEAIRKAHQSRKDISQ